MRFNLPTVGLISKIIEKKIVAELVYGCIFYIYIKNYNTARTKSVVFLSSFIKTQILTFKFGVAITVL